MWLIGADGPQSAGTMDAKAVAPSTTAVLPDLGDSQTLAFTVEPPRRLGAADHPGRSPNCRWSSVRPASVAVGGLGDDVGDVVPTLPRPSLPHRAVALLGDAGQFAVHHVVVADRFERGPDLFDQAAQQRRARAPAAWLSEQVDARRRRDRRGRTSSTPPSTRAASAAASVHRAARRRAPSSPRPGSAWPAGPSRRPWRARRRRAPRSSGSSPTGGHPNRPCRRRASRRRGAASRPTASYSSTESKCGGGPALGQRAHSTLRQLA